MVARDQCSTSLERFELARDERVRPHQVHAENTILSLNAGKPVLCEKPFAINAAQAIDMAAAAKQNNLLLIGCHPESEPHWYECYSWMRGLYHGGRHYKLLRDFVDELMKNKKGPGGPVLVTSSNAAQSLQPINV